MTDLKPCPLCGSAAEWEYRDWDEESGLGDDGTGWLKCVNPKCGFQVFGTMKEDAADIWNKRVAESATPAQ